MLVVIAMAAALTALQPEYFLSAQNLTNIIRQIGMDPVQFGMLMIMCSMIGLLTPPVGILLFAVSSIAKVSVGAIVRELWPMLIAICAVTLMVAYWPAVSLWMPRALL